MAGSLETDANAAGDRPGKLSEWTTSTALIAFTIALALLCVLVLTCTLAQTRISTISIDGVGVSIWKLNDMRKQWNGIRNQIRDATDDLAHLWEALPDIARRKAAITYYRHQIPLGKPAPAYRLLNEGWRAPDGSPGHQASRSPSGPWIIWS